MHTAPARSLSHLLLATTLTAAAHAQVDALPGDVVVCKYNPFGASSLQHHRADGTHVASCVGPTSWYVGAVLLADGRYATTSRDPFAVRFFDASGAETGWFALPEIAFLPGDLDEFADGTLVVVDQGGELELYSPAGVHQATYTAPGLSHPFGVHVDVQDTVWALDVDTHKLFQWNRQGTHLQTISLNFGPGDVVRDRDGTLWVTHQYYNWVWHLSATGEPLSSFLPQVDGFGYLQCIGLFPDGTLALAQDHVASISRYSRSGDFLGSFPTAGEGKNMFLQVIGQGEQGVVFCSGDGSGTPCPCANEAAAREGCATSTGAGGRLRAAGPASVADDALSFHANQLVPGQPVLLFAGDNAVQGGAGAHFGDGLRCAGGSVVRLGVAIADAGGTASWGPGLLVGAGFAAGDVRRFQGWFRDPQGSPCGSSFNLTNGVELALRP